MTRLIFIALFPWTVVGFAGMTPPPPPPPSPEISRRESLATATATAAAALFVPIIILGGGGLSMSTPALAEVTEETAKVTTRMGGLLERYQDGNRGWTILAPSGWNKFDGEVGAYDTKWQDLVDPRENIKVSSTPVKSTTTSINALGTDVQALGESLATKRNAKLVRAEERITDGILFYVFDFAIKDGTHQLLQLCVNKGRIWSLDANTVEKRWPKREELYYNVIGSFMPKLA